MAALMNKKIGSGGKSVSRGKLPVKRTINLAGIGEKPIKASIAIPAIILIILAAAVLSKFFVYDRLRAVSAAEKEANAVRIELNDTYARMNDFGELSERYAHFTYSDMTEDELNRADRVAVVTMIEEVIQPRAELNSWSLTGNQVSLAITGRDLEEVTRLVNLIEEQEWVSYCTVSNATATDTDPDGDPRGAAASATTVTSHITIYLKTQQEVLGE